ncbi:MAG: PQQ-like beta-propeller repeat protein, partial [Planctomycetales bacterium]|nr:PQQ-like beta-propeller repeat protein [Planctomycetales bacterium]
WLNWRGPNGNGTADGESYPIEWSASEAVAWTYEIPGAGGSTPVVVGDRIALTTGADERNWVIALDSSGAEVWRTALGTERPGKHKKGSGSNPSPIADDDHVYAYFKSGDLACLDWDGAVVWHHNLQEMFGEDTLWWDLGTSPVRTKNHIVVACMQSGPSPSYLAAFDPNTGELAWKQDRTLPAPEEANQSYSTPIVFERGGKEYLVVLGADHVTGHDAETGEQLWQVGGLNPTQNGYFRSISSPVLADELVIAPYARGESLTAIRLDGSGDITDSHIAWAHADLGADVPTPAYHEGNVYLLRDRGEVVKVDAGSGEVLETLELERNRNAYSASPIIAGGHLYAIREDGMTFVVQLSPKMETVASNSLPEMALASPVFNNGKILIRAGGKLWCIEQ